MFLRSLLVLFPFPILLLLCYGILRLMSVQLPMETGMSEFLSTMFFVSGSAICYFTSRVYGLAHRMQECVRWLAPAGLFMLLALDESFMVHERVSDSFRISELFVFGFYGLSLLGVLFTFRKTSRLFWCFVALFALLCGTSEVADTLSGKEGMLMIAGRLVDIEQVFEAMGALALASAFAIQSSLDFASYVKPRQEEVVPVVRDAHPLRSRVLSTSTTHAAVSEGAGAV